MQICEICFCMRHFCITTLFFLWCVRGYFFCLCHTLKTIFVKPCLMVCWYRLQTMMVWLWGVNLWVFLQSNVSYTKIFDLDQNHLTHNEIWKVVNFFAFLFQKTNFNTKWKVVCCFSWFSILTINISTMKLWCVSSCLKHTDNQINKCPCTKKKLCLCMGCQQPRKF